MGEYADYFYRKEVMATHNFDPGSMYDDGKKKPRKVCPKCGRHMKTNQGVNSHLLDYHSITSIEKCKKTVAGLREARKVDRRTLEEPFTI